MAKHQKTLESPTSNQRLISLVERIERLIEEKKEISAAIADIKQEAKSAGFDTKVITQMIRERAMGDAEREEHLALAEIYRAALGMLNGTPLGEAARKRFSPPPAPPSEATTTAEPQELPPVPDAPKPPTEQDILQARLHGGEAALAGQPVTKNPWQFSDPRRAAFDEGWCSQAGSDGMDVPSAWRRTKTKPQAAQPEA